MLCLDYTLKSSKKQLKILTTTTYSSILQLDSRGNMLRLKELRAKFNITQKDLAKRLQMSQQAIAKWENGTAEPSVKNLRELAVIFGISVDNLLCDSKTVKTTHFCSYGPKKNEDIEIDGFWGNLGVKIKGQKKSRWYPITQKTYEYIYMAIQNENKWINIETLNNKYLLINKTNIKKFSLVEEACDAVPDDWDLQWDAYDGNCDVAYDCLYDYLCEGTENIPERLLQGIKDVIKNNNLSDYDLEKSVCLLGVIDADGQEEYMFPNLWSQIQELFDWYEELNEQNVSSIIVEADEGDFFFNSNEVAVIEAPINQMKNDK